MYDRNHYLAVVAIELGPFTRDFFPWVFMEEHEGGGTPTWQNMDIVMDCWQARRKACWSIINALRQAEKDGDEFGWPTTSGKGYDMLQVAKKEFENAELMLIYAVRVGVEEKKRREVEWERKNNELYQRAEDKVNQILV